MINEELSLKLQEGIPIQVDDLFIPSLRLSDINKIGYDTYQKYISYALYEFDESTFDAEGMETLRLLMPYQFFSLSNQSEAFLNTVKAFEFFFSSKAEMNDNLEIIFISGMNEGKVLSRDKYNEVKNMLKIIYGLADDKEEEYIPADDKAKEIMAKIKTAKEKVKKKQDTGIRFSNIVSAVSTKSNSINRFNIFNLTIFQLYDEFKRLTAIDNFNMNFSAMMQGAKIDELEHWSSS